MTGVELLIFVSCIAIDGDSLKCDSQNVRLWGIDAPEMQQYCRSFDQPYLCGLEARKAMEKE